VDWSERFDFELANAENARARGNEGQARVCARRAAGVAAAEYYARRGLPPTTSSAVDVLRRLLADAAAPAPALPLITDLLLKVNEEFRLPAGVDLIADARALRLVLLPEPPA
jgi:hypothetical protein